MPSSGPQGSPVLCLHPLPCSPGTSHNGILTHTELLPTSELQPAVPPAVPSAPRSWHLRSHVTSSERSALTPGPVSPARDRIVLFSADI